MAKTKAAAQQERRADRNVVTNRRALHDYFVLESLEAGLVLTDKEARQLQHHELASEQQKKYRQETRERREKAKLLRPDLPECPPNGPQK